eukprot:TRINITY_DN15287_c0_g1_i2.p1 TRINITY_DN15287_c0_g1~~TRINITY_DN15287_c0_g1_i2.p1  ORF type:complete len:183 (+),score=17.94 TRINITY_DN15287_c0_g1_i2:190-738(+)
MCIRDRYQRRVHGVLYDLIDLSLIESGQEIKLNKEKIAIELVLSDLKKLFESSRFITNKEISIQYLRPGISMAFYSDRKRIEHILYHLIDIIIKITDQKIIKCGYKYDSHSLTFFVKDGTIPVEEKDQLFDTFYSHRENRKYLEIYGISLVWVTKMTELLGGTIYYSACNTRTIFNVTFPLK